MGIYFNNNPKIKIGYEYINEVYFGESKGLQDIQDQISLIRGKYKSNNKYFSKINSDADMQKLNRLFESFFGFETFSLVVEETSLYNAYTFPLSWAVGTGNAKDNIETTKTGFRFKKNKGLNAFVVVHAGLFLSDELSDREVLAVILHEIGHNFESSLDDICVFRSYFNKCFSFILLLTAPIHLLIGNGQAVASSSNQLRGWTNRTAEKIKRDNKGLNDIFHMVKGLTGIVTDIITNVNALQSLFVTVLNPIGVFIGSIYGNIMNTIQNPIMFIRQMFGGVRSERVADNFASMYGYGPDLSSALRKFDEEGYGISAYKAGKNIPIFGHLYDLYSVPITTILSLMDPHPNTAARMYDQFNYIRKELNKADIDPKMKKQLNKECHEIDMLLKDVYSNMDIEDTDFFSRAYSGLLLKICGGDPKVVFEPRLNDKFDKVANKTRIK